MSRAYDARAHAVQPFERGGTLEICSRMGIRAAECRRRVGEHRSHYVRAECREMMQRDLAPRGVHRLQR